MTSHTRRMSRFTGLAATVLAAGTALAACGGSSSGGSSSTGTTKTDSSPITVGFVSDASGAYGATFGPSVQGAKAYVNEVNASGGINGHPLKLKVYDTKSDPTTAVQVARQAVADKDFALVAVSQFIDTALPYLANQKMPVLGYGVSTQWYLPGRSTFFSWSGNIITKSATAWVKYFQDLGKTKLAVVADATPGPHDAGARWIKMVNGTGAQTVYSNLNLNVQDPGSLLAIAQRIKDSGAQGVLSTMGAGNVQLQVDLNQVNAGISVVSGGDYSDDVPKQYGTAANGYVAGTFFTPFQATGVAGLQQYFKAVSSEPASLQRNAFAADGYISMRFFGDGLAGAGSSPTQQSLITKMNSLKDYTMDGLLQPVSFPQFHTDPAPCVAFVELQSKKWTPVGKQSFTCGTTFVS